MTMLDMTTDTLWQTIMDDDSRVGCDWPGCEHEAKWHHTCRYCAKQRYRCRRDHAIGLPLDSVMTIYCALEVGGCGVPYLRETWMSLYHVI